MSCVRIVFGGALSWNVPIAMKRPPVPIARAAEFGDTEIDCNVARLTVSVVDPATLPSAARIVVVPGVAPLTRPWLPAVLLTVATEVADELQVTCVVRFW